MIKINHKEDCCGCGACATVCAKGCITMQADFQGFLYPLVNNKSCTECHLCENVCPIINAPSRQKPIKEVAYAAFNHNQQVRKTSSSGGMFQLLAEHTIQQGGVVFGARFDDNWNVIHGHAETPEGIEAFRRSKYVQSNTNGCFKTVKQFLNVGRQVLFTGTPCQVAALRNYLHKDYDNLLTVTFTCHGVPSQKVWRKYLNEKITELSRQHNVEASKIKITAVNFRDKVNAWRKFNLTIEFNIEDKETIILSEPVWENDYMLSFLTDYANRPSCYHCRFRCGKSGCDMTISDFWGVENCMDDADFIGENGTSHILLHTEKAQAIFSSINCECKEVDFENSLKGNSAYKQDWPCPITHDYFFRQLHRKSIKEAMDDANEKSRVLNKYKEKSAKSLKYKLKYKFLQYLYTNRQ